MDDLRGLRRRRLPRFYDVGALVELARPLVPRAAGGSGSGRMLAAESASLGANGTLHAVAQCAPWNVTAAGCAACLNRSVRDVPDEDRLIRAPLQLQPAVRDIRSGAAAYGKGARIRKWIQDNPVVVIESVVAVVGVVAIMAASAFLIGKRNTMRNRLNSTHS
ncbi:hypothetical protein ZWY2020_052878 [Hordeum vulgare]|nr:hypothetical protein ZWY2020_052878 [Hordeum vulgare]